MVKRLTTMRETWVQSLGLEDLLEKEMATHSSILAWRDSMDRGAWWATVRGVAKSWTWLSTHTHTHIDEQGVFMYGLSVFKNNFGCAGSLLLHGLFCI